MILILANFDLPFHSDGGTFSARDRLSDTEIVLTLGYRILAVSQSLAD